MDYDHEKLVAVLLYAAITWYLAPYAAKQAGDKGSEKDPPKHLN